jgi:fumarate reductase subunit C
LFGQITGIEAVTSMERVRGGLLIPYAVLLICVEFHAGIGLYRLAVKWGVGSRLSRHTLWIIEKTIFWVFLVLGILILLVLAGFVPAPFAFLLQ